MRNHTFLLVLMSVLLQNHVSAQKIEAFTEPYQRIAVPAAEIGIIEVLHVKEGDLVQSNQILGKLDDKVLVASLNVAEAATKATGARRSAEADYKMRQEQLKGYLSLVRDGNATSRELEQAELEVQQASARLQSVHEDLEVRRLEVERIQAQIQQRQIVSPINGIVVAIEKKAGEFVSPTSPTVLHLVQLDALIAVFSVPRFEAAKMLVGQEVPLAIGIQEGEAIGTIEFVSPIANPESNTVEVKVRIANKDRKWPSGVSCHWELSTSGDGPIEPVTRTSQMTPPDAKER